MRYNRCGRSGLLLPADLARALAELRRRPAARDEPRDRAPRVRPRRSRTSTSPTTTARRTARPRRPSAGCSARTSRPYRDELIISTKAGYDMWPGPYGEWGSRKYLLASLDQSLRRLGLDYVDIFYSHRLDPDTPLEETMGALDTRRAAGQGALRGHLLVLAEQTARGGGDPARARHAAADPPALVLDAQPLDRARSCSTCSAREGIGCIVLLAARPGPAHRPVPGRDPGGLAGEPRRLAVARRCSRSETLPRVRALERDRRAARPDASPRWRSPGRCATRA